MRKYRVLAPLLAGVFALSGPAIRAEDEADYRSPGNTSRYITFSSNMSPGQRLVQSALKLYEDYGDKPYVWGGECLDVGYKDAKNDPFFKGVAVTSTQPAGSWRAGQPTRNGVDCSGYPWQAGKRAGLEPFCSARLSAGGYRTKGKAVLPTGRYTEAQISATARPGDLIFKIKAVKVKNKKDKETIRNVTTHVAIYAGDVDGDGSPDILESSGTKEPDYDKVSPEQWQKWREYAKPEKHGKTDYDRGGIKKSHPLDYAGKRIEIRTMFDRVHEVRSGDSLWKLSRKYGKSINWIRRRNGLKSDVIKVGQRLRF